MSDIMFVTIPAPGPESRLYRHTKHLGILARTSRHGPLTIRFSQVELELLNRAAEVQGIQRHLLVREAALSVAEAIANGKVSDGVPFARETAGYHRR